jgi:branched-chain amino acid aminotransferase
MRPYAEPRRSQIPQPWTSNGCFETMRAYAGRIFRLEAHLDRLAASAALLGTRLSSDRDGLRRQLRRALARSGLSEAIVRVALLPRRQGPAVASIVVQRIAPPPRSAYRRGIRVAVVPTRPFAVGAVSPQAKYSARLSSVLAVIEAQVRGVDEALFMDARGLVTESTASNVGIVRRQVILTPPCSLGLLAGITREILFEVAGRVGCPIRETPLTRHDLYTAEEAFLTSTTKEVLPVTWIDGRRIGAGRPGPLTRRLSRAFRELIRAVP